MRVITRLLYALVISLFWLVAARYYVPAKLAGFKAARICRRHFAANLKVTNCHTACVGGELVPRKGYYTLRLYHQTWGEHLNLYWLKRQEISADRFSQALAKLHAQIQAERTRLAELSTQLGSPLWLLRNHHANELHQQQILLLMPPETPQALTPWLKRLARLLLDNPDCCAYLISKEQQVNLANRLEPALLTERLGENVRLKYGIPGHKITTGGFCPYRLIEAQSCLKLYRPQNFGKLQPEISGIIPQTLSLDHALLRQAFPSLFIWPLSPPSE
ncbi:MULTISPECIES: hypothetical protein [unclassified Vibrio]|uniref:hypothetical protein n=1 Tax=unclassified Vibrio TaxID=2614977 RepID=UPI0014822639|nr:MULTISPECIES: hypothetical protein [unclassified Vibrio]NNN43962.1 hypothetical protein [Vibrio sp. 1-1(7)]NNN71786.1 hypothetical protein [Vibrio sp. 12-2(3-a)]